MDRSEITRLRVANQCLAGSAFTRPDEVVRWFGAMQSQDLPASLYAIGLRMRQATEDLVERALTNGSIVRSWPMRRTIHCMAAEDARWMIRMLAPRGIARMQTYYRAMKITDEELERAGKILESALTRNTRLTRPELYERLNAEGVATSSTQAPMRGLHLLVHWAHAGLICLAARRGKQPTFALLEDWTPRGRDLSGDDALAELATVYFRAHGPATVKDSPGGPGWLWAKRSERCNWPGIFSAAPRSPGWSTGSTAMAPRQHRGRCLFCFCRLTMNTRWRTRTVLSRAIRSFCPLSATAWRRTSSLKGASQAHGSVPSLHEDRSRSRRPCCAL